MEAACSSVTDCWRARSSASRQAASGLSGAVEVMRRRGPAGAFACALLRGLLLRGGAEVAAGFFVVVAGDGALGFELGGAAGDALGGGFLGFFGGDDFAFAGVDGAGGGGGFGGFAFVGAGAGLAVLFAEAFWCFLGCHVVPRSLRLRRAYYRCER